VAMHGERGPFGERRDHDHSHRLRPRKPKNRQFHRDASGQDDGRDRCRPQGRCLRPVQADPVCE
jgi:hypothetical protein